MNATDGYVLVYTYDELRNTINGTLANLAEDWDYYYSGKLTGSPIEFKR